MAYNEIRSLNPHFRSLMSASSGSGLATPFFTLSYACRWSCQLSVLKILPQVIYVATIIMFQDELILPQGWVAGQWVWGTTVYLATLVTVLAKAALISEWVPSNLGSIDNHLRSGLSSLWTKYTLAAIPGSLAFAMAFLPLYQWIAPLSGGGHLISAARRYVYLTFTPFFSVD